MKFSIKIDSDDFEKLNEALKEMELSEKDDEKRELVNRYRENMVTAFYAKCI